MFRDVTVRGIENFQLEPGDKFVITGQTNLAVDNELFIEVISRIVPPDVKPEFSIRGITRVVRGDSGINAFHFPVDLVDAKPGEYVINVISYKHEKIWSLTFQVI